MLQPRGLEKGNQRRLSRVRADVSYCFYLVAQRATMMHGQHNEVMTPTSTAGDWATQTSIIATRCQLSTRLNKEGQALIKMIDQLHDESLGKLISDRTHIHMYHMFKFKHTIFKHNIYHLHNYLLDTVHTFIRGCNQKGFIH